MTFFVVFVFRQAANAMIITAINNKTPIMPFSDHNSKYWQCGWFVIGVLSGFKNTVCTWKRDKNTWNFPYPIPEAVWRRSFSMCRAIWKILCFEISRFNMAEQQWKTDYKSYKADPFKIRRLCFLRQRNQANDIPMAYPVSAAFESSGQGFRIRREKVVSSR